MPLARAKPSPLWWDELPPRPARPARAGDVEADVVIVGAGFTGLWTGYYLKRLAPDLEVVVLEREHAGFGASGRNGGWCHPEYPLGLATLVDRHGRDAALRFQRSAIDAVDEVGRVSASEGIDCHYQLGGRLLLARTPLQNERAKQDVAHEHGFGLTEDEVRYVGRDEAHGMTGMSRVHGGSYLRHAAALQPALLAHGLAAAAERLGVRILEGAAVTRMSTGAVTAQTASGMLTGGRVLHHLFQVAPDHRNTIVLAGYQAAGTRGEALLHGASTLRVFGDDIPVRARVVQLDSLSAHADADELINWLGAAPRAPRAVSVVHGEAGAADALRRRIRHQLAWSATVPGHGTSVTVTARATDQ